MFRKCGLKAACGLAMAMAGITNAQPTTPVYSASFQDCVTADNRFRGSDGKWFWDVDPGCDIYQHDVYERPMTQEFIFTRGRFGAKEYFEYLDIVQAKAGFDSQYFYVAIKMFGRDHITSDGSRDRKGMIERYGFRLSTDPDGRYGMLVVSDQPEVKNSPNTRFGPLGTFVYVDEDGDVGGASSGPTGRSITKSDNPDEEDGMTGYETPIVSDGRLDGGRRVLWVRLDPNDRTIVEFALDYRRVGLTAGDLNRLRYLDFEAIKGGPKDPQNYLWNDKYTKQEAGSPNYGGNGRSEFGTNGLQNIYEVDTLRGRSLVDLSWDFNGDGHSDALDAMSFMEELAIGSDLADLNGDGSVDVFDLIEMTQLVR